MALSLFFHAHEPAALEFTAHFGADGRAALRHLPRVSPFVRVEVAPGGFAFAANDLANVGTEYVLGPILGAVPGPEHAARLTEHAHRRLCQVAAAPFN